jgi:hypothetical protein
VIGLENNILALATSNLFRFCSHSQTSPLALLWFPCIVFFELQTSCQLCIHVNIQSACSVCVAIVHCSLCVGMSQSKHDESDCAPESDALEMTMSTLLTPMSTASAASACQPVTRVSLPRLSEWSQHLLRDLLIPWLSPASYVAFVGTCKYLRQFVLNNTILQNGELPFVRAMHAISLGRNIFLNASGGYGKTYLLNRLKEAVERRMERTIELTATTGLAASALTDGRTIHSASGLGKGTISIPNLQESLDKDVHHKLYAKAWASKDILAIDEVGMFGTNMFTKCDMVSRHAKKRPHDVLGGVLLIIAGDFMQLACIGDTILIKSPMWDKMNFVVIDMLIPHRQFDDPKYQQMLTRIRMGDQTREDVTLLKERYEESQDIDWDKRLIRPTRLFPHAVDVQAQNQDEFNKLIEADLDFDLTQEEKEEAMAAAEAAAAAAAAGAAAGAAVAVPLQQHPDVPEMDWVAEDEVCEYVSTKDPYTKVTVKQLRPSTAMTVANARSNIGSRINQRVPEVIRWKRGALYGLTFNFDRKHSNGSSCVYVGRGLLRFEDGSKLHRDNFMTMVLEPIPKSNNLYLRRRQLGLRLRYADTYHGAQGKTLDCAELDLGPKVFAACTAYVGLSRLKSIKGLYLRNFDEKSLRVNKVAKEFYLDLERERMSNPDYDPMFFYIPPLNSSKEAKRRQGLYSFITPSTPKPKRRKTNHTNDTASCSAAAASSGACTGDNEDTKAPKRKRKRTSDASATTLTSKRPRNNGLSRDVAQGPPGGASILVDDLLSWYHTHDRTTDREGCASIPEILIQPAAVSAAAAVVEGSKGSKGSQAVPMEIDDDKTIGTATNPMDLSLL